ncbi:hypothetical protein RRG08_023058 [Elysia crispata]|uniref:Uncharacterized protein n=1 Tax=Elysia crispata TaxID=231223 RepID=A0AAE1E5U8_9GAST|nr:hypothetical protein RRG08_023058 [Elysia crispata]
MYVPISGQGPIAINTKGLASFIDFQILHQMLQLCCNKTWRSQTLISVSSRLDDHDCTYSRMERHNQTVVSCSGLEDHENTVVWEDIIILTCPPLVWKAQSNCRIFL